MRMICGIVTPLALSLGVTTATFATTVTIGFNDPALDSNAPPGYSEAGFQFSPTLGFFGTPFPTNPTIPSSSIYVLTQPYTSLTSADGQLFILDSIAAAALLPDPADFGEEFVILCLQSVNNYAHDTMVSIPYVNQPGFSTYALPSVKAAEIVFLGIQFPGGPPPTVGAYYDNLVITPDLGTPHPIPEPATWMMMILGLGLAGARIRAALKARA